MGKLLFRVDSVSHGAFIDDSCVEDLSLPQGQLQAELVLHQACVGPVCWCDVPSAGVMLPISCQGRPASQTRVKPLPRDLVCTEDVYVACVHHVH